MPAQDFTQIQPCLIVVFSGKRKSGKDYVTEKLLDYINNNELFRQSKISAAHVVRLSAPIKEQFSKMHGLDFTKLLDATEYKEKYRKDMIEWSEKKRKENPDYFVEIAVKDLLLSLNKNQNNDNDHGNNTNNNSINNNNDNNDVVDATVITTSAIFNNDNDVYNSIWIVSDARRLSDVSFFKKCYTNVMTVRVYASQNTRADRGFVFTEGIDDKESECGLDVYPEGWSYIFDNDTPEGCDESFKFMINDIVRRIDNST